MTLPTDRPSLSPRTIAVSGEDASCPSRRPYQSIRASTLGTSLQ